MNLNQHLTMVLVILVSCMSGCSSVRIGMGANSPGMDGPEIGLDNPIGIIRGESHYKAFTFACEHHSGIFTEEEGGGYNLCSVSTSINAVLNFW